MMTSGAKARIARLAVVGLLAVPTVSVVAGPALAAGTSTKTSGCYVQWWNTAWAAKCQPASQSGNYKAHVARALELNYDGPWRYVSKGSTTTFDSGEAWRGVQSSGNYVTYKG